MKPIIFSGPMIKAILAGKKNMTRRPVKPQPEKSWGDVYQWHSKGVSICTGCDKLKDSLVDYAPYKPGEILYVREKWATYTDKEGTSGILYAAEPMFDNCNPGDIDWTWRSSRFMPQVAARIFLKVTEVSIDRLQNISEDDAEREGIHHECGDCTECEGESAGKNCTDYPIAFSELWDSIYAKNPEYQWDKNCFVWVIKFERTEKP